MRRNVLHISFWGTTSAETTIHTYLRTLYATIEGECETVTFVHAVQKVTIGDHKNTHYQPCNKFLSCYFYYLQVVIAVTRKATWKMTMWRQVLQVITDTSSRYWYPINKKFPSTIPGGRSKQAVYTYFTSYNDSVMRVWREPVRKAFFQCFAELSFL